jgi:hypothetical protein
LQPKRRYNEETKATKDVKGLNKLADYMEDYSFEAESSFLRRKAKEFSS